MAIRRSWGRTVGDNYEAIAQTKVTLLLADRLI